MLFKSVFTELLFIGCLAATSITLSMLQRILSGHGEPRPFAGETVT
ncbi:hypothetical protein IOK_18747 [Yersinia enterocolitica subsp. palearctica PhRBD_Ye1]|uniref:Uncharacterized protein n=1 Tax=Yersinia enterocolitica W22703 TaxID=913028 RepID=F4N216_YEREN|nr:hypothetical protein IOK_18747 [Yersinia enterocolitica subsp. palearctica PhRBD_Ye1]CBX72124.1 unknown protein [Yersinia enterocolitica W22703]